MVSREFEKRVSDLLLITVDDEQVVWEVGLVVLCEDCALGNYLSDLTVKGFL